MGMATGERGRQEGKSVGTLSLLVVCFVGIVVRPEELVRTEIDDSNGWRNLAKWREVREDTQLQIDGLLSFRGAPRCPGSRGGEAGVA